MVCMYIGSCGAPQFHNIIEAYNKMIFLAECLVLAIPVTYLLEHGTVSRESEIELFDKLK